MRVLTVRVTPGTYLAIQSDLEQQIGITPDTKEMSILTVDLVYHFSDTQDTEKMEKVLQEKIDQKCILEFSLQSFPETTKEEESEEITLEALEAASHEITNLYDCNHPLVPDNTCLSVIERALEQLIQLRRSFHYPFHYVELPEAPSLLFPIKNSATAGTIWLEVTPSGCALTIIAHKEKPVIEDASQFSPKTAMAGLGIDYHVQDEDRSQELLQVFLHNEKESPYGEAHWDLPGVLNTTQDSPIVLVDDVQAWQPSEEEKGNTHE